MAHLKATRALTLRGTTSDRLKPIHTLLRLSVPLLLVAKSAVMLVNTASQGFKLNLQMLVFFFQRLILRYGNLKRVKLLRLSRSISLSDGTTLFHVINRVFSVEQSHFVPFPFNSETSKRDQMVTILEKR